MLNLKNVVLHCLWLRPSWIMDTTYEYDITTTRIMVFILFFSSHFDNNNTLSVVFYLIFLLLHYSFIVHDISTFNHYFLMNLGIDNFKYL